MTNPIINIKLSTVIRNLGTDVLLVEVVTKGTFQTVPVKEFIAKWVKIFLLQPNTSFTANLKSNIAGSASFFFLVELFAVGVDLGALVVLVEVKPE
jgi:hypothetical protein